MANRLQKSKRGIFRKVPILTIASVCVIGMLYFSISSVESTNIEEKEQTIEELIMRSALHCYAMEGAYPEDIEYLVENYNLHIDMESYTVNYEVSTTNQAPEISVTYGTSEEGGA